MFLVKENALPSLSLGSRYFAGEVYSRVGECGERSGQGNHFLQFGRSAEGERLSRLRYQDRSVLEH